MEPINETALIPDTSAPKSQPDTETAREKFEQARLSRRAALQKIGMTSGMAFFGLFAVDDLARLAIKRMEQHKETRQIAETVATEFKNSGIAFADATGSSSGTSCTLPCAECGTTYAKQTNDIQKCQTACGDCCKTTAKKSLPCGTRADADINACQQACADYFGQPG